MPSTSTPTVRLDALRAQDSDRLFEWINDRETVLYNAPFKPVARADHDEWFARSTRRADAAIFAIREDELVGTVQLIDISKVHRSAELTIRLAPGCRGRGIGSAALTLLFEHGRRHLKLHRIWLRVFADNGRAIRAYEKVGMVREGVMREAANIEGVWKDTVIMGILFEENH